MEAVALQPCVGQPSSTSRRPLVEGLRVPSSLGVGVPSSPSAPSKAASTVIVSALAVASITPLCRAQGRRRRRRFSFLVRTASAGASYHDAPAVADAEQSRRRMCVSVASSATSLLLPAAIRQDSAIAVEQRPALRGRSLEVPRVLIGCWKLLERYKDEEVALDTLEAYADAGFRAFDTADIYGPSEEILGKFRKRYADTRGADAANQLRVFTKYVPLNDPSEATAVEVNNRSREALGVSSLDAVQYCWYGAFDKGHIDAAVQLRKLQEAGKIDHLCGCNYDTQHLAELVEAGIPIEANQVQFSLLDLRPENGMLEYCKSKGIKLLCFGTVAGGWLSDRYLGAPPPLPLVPLVDGTESQRLYYASLQAWCSPWSYLSPFGWPVFQELLQTLRSVADKHQSTIANVAMAWVQRRLDDTCGGGIIVGVRDKAHLSDLKALESLRLDDADMAQIRVALNRGSPATGDVWDRERFPGSLVWSTVQSWPLYALVAARQLSRTLRPR